MEANNINKSLTDEEIHKRIITCSPKQYKEEIKGLMKIHKEIEEQDKSFHKTKLVLKQYSKSDLSVGYFGSQGRFYVSFLKEYFRKVLKFNPVYFAEVPAGSNSISYGMIQHNIPIVATCDINYWSWCISKGILENNEIVLPEEIENILGQMHNGYLVKERDDLPMPLDVKQCIDGIVNCINKANKNKYYLVLAVIGKYLLNNLTFRSMSWDKNRMKDKKYCSLSTLHNYLKKWIGIFNNRTINKGKSKSKVISFHGDYFDFFNSISPPQKGSVLYCDFDWPWSDGKETKIYTWYIEDISAILRGKTHLQNIEYWTKDNIKEELLNVIKTGLTKFEYVFLSTQSSNYPSIKELKEWICEIATIKDYCFLDTPSLVANKNFREELLVLQQKSNKEQ